jgi:hypothetical protein
MDNRKKAAMLAEVLEAEDDVVLGRPDATLCVTALRAYSNIPKISSLVVAVSLFVTFLAMSAMPLIDVNMDGKLNADDVRIVAYDVLSAIDGAAKPSGADVKHVSVEVLR